MGILCLGQVESSAAPSKPNIVMIISDDQAWTDYGFMGHPVIKTPHLDALAQRSAFFSRGYVPTALCRPSLATLATGRYTHQHGITGNDPSPKLAPANSPAYNALREKLISNIDRFDTLPELLAEQGYLSHQSGKWWEGSWQRGGFTHGMTRGFPKQGGRHGDDGLKIGRSGMEPVLDFVDAAVKEDKPFFLWYAPFLPHTPHNPPDRLVKKYTAKGRPEALVKYYAMCDWFDETCGTLIDHIEAKGLTRNTVFVYVTDNGWIQRTPETQVPAGWKDGFAPKSKQSPYEGGTRTPILISWPGVIQPGAREEWVSSIDLFPTLLDVAGARVPKGLPGVDLLPVVRDGKKLDRKALFGESFAHDVANLDNPEASLLYRWTIQGRWKLLLTYDGEVNRYASSHLRDEKRPQLFDLISDPHETRNVAGDHPELVAQMAADLQAWWPVTQRQVLTRFEP